MDPAVKITERTQLTNPVGSLTDALSGRITAGGQLENEGDSVTVTIALKMRESAGNEYQGLSIGDGFTIQLYASQLASESDSFDNQYDKDGGFDSFNSSYSTASTFEAANGQITTALSMSDETSKIKADVPEGVQLANGASVLSFTVSSMAESQTNITVEEDEEASSLDVHIEGVDPNNTVPIAVTLSAYLPRGLNAGNHRIYHVENDQAVEMTYLTEGETPAHNTYTYDPATGDVVMYLATFSETRAIVKKNAVWNGGADYSWYAPEKTRLTISSADQLAAFARLVGGMAVTDTGAEIYPRDDFAGKIVKLTCDIDLGWRGVEDGYHYFNPIGYYFTDDYDDDGILDADEANADVYSTIYSFEGTFDGCGNTIKNFYQNTWATKGDYNDDYPAKSNHYKDGFGLFGYVLNGTVKNLTVENFSSDGEFTPTGVITAYTQGNSTFENISIKDCNPRVYNTGNGGIIGIAGSTSTANDDHIVLKNITVDNTNKISALWGSWDVACGGLVGMYRGNVDGNGNATGDTISITDCHVAAQIDVYNDVCANYQYYAYRYAGMIIGSVRHNTKDATTGREIPNMTGISATRCTVHFGTWNDYYYCELVDNSPASYTHDYQMSRLVEIQDINTDAKTYLPLGKDKDVADNWVAIPTSGRVNYVIVDYSKGHGTENATCHHFKNGDIWTHDMAGIQTGVDEDGDKEDDLKEDKQHLYLEFNNLFTGYGWGVSSMGLNNWHGVQPLDVTFVAANEEAIAKFEATNVTSATCETITLGELFTAIEGELSVPISSESVYVGVKNENGGTVTATFTRENKTGKENFTWADYSLRFSGAGTVQVTIQDYYYCIPATITLTINEHTDSSVFVGRVTKADDPDGFGYELWACSTCMEAQKIVANHEDGHRFAADGNCVCGAKAIEGKNLEVASHKFDAYNSGENLSLSITSFLQFPGVMEDGKWAISATQAEFVPSRSAIQPAVSSGISGNQKIVQMMQGTVNDGGILKSVSKVYISFDLYYDMAENSNFSLLDSEGKVRQEVFFSFRTTEKNGQGHQKNEAQLHAQMADSVLSLVNPTTKALYALVEETNYTVTLEIDPETKEYKFLLNGGDYSNETIVTGSLHYELSDYLTSVFRSNAFSFVDMDTIERFYEAYGNSNSTEFIAAYEAYVADLKTNTGVFYLDNVSFSCDTRGVDATHAEKSDCVHTWNAVEIAGETDLYQYTCSECDHFFKGTSTEFVKVVDFALIDFETKSTRIHDNLKAKADGTGFVSAGYFTKIDGNTMWDLTTNNYFWIKSKNVPGGESFDNPAFTQLMTGSYNGDQVDIVEMKFDLLYTGDIGQLTTTDLALVLYQSKSDQAYDVWKLYFDKSTDGKNGLLYFAGMDKIVIEEGKNYTVTLRMQPAATANRKYALTLSVHAANGALISEYTKEVTNSYNTFNQIIFSRPEYRYSDVTNKIKYQDFHIYLDNLTVSYETPVEMQ